jgi:REP element-mobilizing transposase RayT
MILGSHVIIAAYGFWLPNEQRGSWSDFIRSWELLRFGPATKVQTSRSVAHRPYDRSRRREKEKALKYPAVKFSGEQALCVAQAFADQVCKSGFHIPACTILPRHTHLVILRHRYHVEQVTNLLKGAATRALTLAGLHPVEGMVPTREKLPSPWSVGLWKVFLDSQQDIVRSIEYVERNAEREGKKRQSWKSVESYVI